MRKESQILNMKNCTTTRWLYRSKTVVACGVASLALRGVPLFAQTPDVVVQLERCSIAGRARFKNWTANGCARTVYSPQLPLRRLGGLRPDGRGNGVRPAMRFAQPN